MQTRVLRRGLVPAWNSLVGNIVFLYSATDETYYNLDTWTLPPHAQRALAWSIATCFSKRHCVRRRRPTQSSTLLQGPAVCSVISSVSWGTVFASIQPLRFNVLENEAVKWDSTLDVVLISPYSILQWCYSLHVEEIRQERQNFVWVSYFLRTKEYLQSDYFIFSSPSLGVRKTISDFAVSCVYQTGASYSVDVLVITLDCFNCPIVML